MEAARGVVADRAWALRSVLRWRRADSDGQPAQHGTGATARPNLPAPGAPVSDHRPARQDFRVLARHRAGAGGVDVIDVQLQWAATRELVWSQTFSAADQAEQFQSEVEQDLTALDGPTFRRKYGVPATA